MGRKGERDKGIQTSSYEISHGDVTYITGNIVNSIKVTNTVTDGYQTYWGDHFKGI